MPVGRSPHACVLHVPAFAEEMNKSRRMVARQARAWCEQGVAVLVLDLHGCGDSSGELAEASWSSWLADIESAALWLQSRTGAPIWLWGLRAGCLLAAQAADRLPELQGLIAWAPNPSGKQLLQQFLRMKSAAGLLTSGSGEGNSTEQLRSQLSAGQSVEVAGYQLPPAIAKGLEQASLTAPTHGASWQGGLWWMELSTREELALSPVGAKTCDQWGAAGVPVSRRAVRGPAFWQTTEIEVAPALIEATLEITANTAGQRVTGP